MEKPETTTPAKARDALIKPDRTAAWRPGQWVDAVTQEYNIQREAASTAESDRNSLSRRLHLAAAASLAEILMQYFRAAEQPDESQYWKQRADRLNAQAYRRSNSLLSKIGGVAP